MSDNKKQSKEKRIKQEERRLKATYRDLEQDKMNVVSGLIQRAAYMRICLEDFEADLDTNGFTEMFSQGNQEPYERKRPTADLYNTMNASYQKAVKQLTELLPKNEVKKSDDDDFNNFVNEREDI